MGKINYLLEEKYFECNFCGNKNYTNKNNCDKCGIDNVTPSSKPICIREVNENLNRIKLGMELTRPLKQLNESCKFKEKYHEMCNIQDGLPEDIDIQSREYRQKPEVKASMREYLRKYRQKPEYKAKMREYYQKPEYKAKMRESQRKYQQKTEYKAKRREYQQKAEVKAKKREYLREYLRKYYQKPEVKAKMRKYYQKPEVKAKMRESQRKYYQKKIKQENHRTK